MAEATTEARFYTDVDALQELVILLNFSLLPEPVLIGSSAHSALKRVIIIVLLRGFQLRISRSLKTADMLPSKRS
jgi:hypothetical protein